MAAKNATDMALGQNETAGATQVLVFGFIYPGAILARVFDHSHLGPEVKPEVDGCVVTWGAPSSGGESIEVQAQLRQVGDEVKFSARTGSRDPARCQLLPFFFFFFFFHPGGFPY